MKNVDVVINIEHPRPDVVAWGVSMSCNGRTKIFSGAAGGVARLNLVAVQRVLEVLSEPVQINIGMNVKIDACEKDELLESFWMHRISFREVQVGLTPQEIQCVIAKESRHADLVLNSNFGVVRKSVEIFGVLVSSVVFRGEYGEIFYWFLPDMIKQPLNSQESCEIQPELF